MKNERNKTDKEKSYLSNLTKKLALFAVTSCIAVTAFGCSGSANSNANNSVSGGDYTSNHSNSTTENSKYSQILQNILSSEYYSWLLDKAKENNDLYDSAQFDPHPYAFLEDEGFDVEAIRNDEIACRTQSFVKENEPNNLYIATYVENKNGNYYTQYMLKYHLTDQEMQEYHKLHSSDNNKFYLEAVFLNNEISKLKDPVILASTKINITAHDKMCESFEGGNYGFGSYFMDVILMSCSTEKQEFRICLLPKMTTLNHMYSECKYGDIYLVEDAASIKMNGDVFMSPYSHGQFDYKEGTSPDDIKSIKMYHPQNTRLKYYSIGQYTPE